MSIDSVPRCSSSSVSRRGKCTIEQVFGNPSNMTKLQDIVWPEIRILAEERIKGLGDEGAESVVLEAAVLLDAGWDDMCDDLWVVQVPPDVAR